MLVSHHPKTNVAREYLFLNPRKPLKDIACGAWIRSEIRDSNNVFAGETFDLRPNR